MKWKKDENNGHIKPAMGNPNRFEGQIYAKQS